MNTYVPVRKFIKKVVTTPRGSISRIKQLLPWCRDWSVNKDGRKVDCPGCTGRSFVYRHSGRLSTCTPKREYTSLLESLDVPKEKRRRRSKWKPWVSVIILTIVLYYGITRWAQLYAGFNEIPGAGKYFTPNNVDFFVKPKEIPVNKFIRDKPKNKSLIILMEPERGSDKLPQCVRNKTYGKVYINITRIRPTATNVYPSLKQGGYYRPPDCKPTYKVGILVPYRNRPDNLGTFLYNIHPFLMRQKLEYQIFVIEQFGNGPFNKGRLFNAGFLQMVKFNTFQCVVLHDLDLLPMHSHILYTCPTLPRHMCAAVNDSESRKHNITYDYKSLFGGVIAMTVNQFRRANGYSNLYFGWGAEDNDLLWRLRASGYPVVRYNKSVGMYAVLPHIREPANPFRHHLLSRALDRYKTDGISNLDYLVQSTKFYHLFTHFIIDINPKNEKYSDITQFY